MYKVSLCVNGAQLHIYFHVQTVVCICVCVHVYRRSCSTQTIFFCSSSIRSLMTLMRSSVPAQASGSRLAQRQGMPSSSFSLARHNLTNSSSDSTRRGNFLCGQETGRKQRCGDKCGNVWNPVSLMRSCRHFATVVCVLVILRKAALTIMGSQTICLFKGTITQKIHQSIRFC